LSLDELAAIRLIACREQFWTALMQVKGQNAGVQNETRKKVEIFLERFARWRKLARQESLSHCLETVLVETHYDDWLRSRPRGAQRYGNVERFLNLAQKFDQFQRQGLFRFLKFIEAQRAAEAEPEVAMAAEENAVRLMSIHQSKGLEFPVVVTADLAKKFNTQDAHSDIIFDGEFGLCPRVKPAPAGRCYPSLTHWLAEQQLRREQAGEEMRLLYVAMTRARDTLILTGSVTQKIWDALPADVGTVTPQKILSAKSYLDWLILWFGQQSGASSARQGELPGLRWRILGNAELAGTTSEKKSGVKAGLTMPGNESMRRLGETLSWRYGFAAATRLNAKSSVTALRREMGDELDDEARPAFPMRQRIRRNLSAADTGTAHHKFLQHVLLEKAGKLELLVVEAERMERENILTAEERNGLDLAAIAAFWNSKEGRSIQGEAAFLGRVRRELKFTAKFSPKELDEILGKASGAGLDDEFVVVQGVADLVVLRPGEIWLVDFKTDEAGTDELVEKVKIHTPQLKLYASALAKIYARPVTNCWLHFLSARRTGIIELAG
jgi:ATP-dependent helicase/nuclease subunit A